MKPIVLINPEAGDEILHNLMSMEFEVITVPFCTNVATPLSGHVDLQCFHYKDKLFCHSGIDRDFLNKIDSHVEVIICNSKLSCNYPDDIPFNIACTGPFAFHRLDRTDPAIKSYLENDDVKIIDVAQGYTKCSTLIVDEKSIITADKSIRFAAESAGLNSLLITQGHVSLPGYRYGFIGGASGMYENTVYVTGSINFHPDAQDIINFINKAGKKIITLSKEPLLDLGSLIILPHNHQYK